MAGAGASVTSNSCTARISAGCRRSSSPSRRSRGTSITVRLPLASAIHAMPAVAPVTCTAASRLSRDAASSAESVMVPGVTMRVTLRSTGPFEVAGSPTCSQMAADSPAFTSLARYGSSAWYGTPAMRIGWPPELPRAVSVMSRSFAARSASPWKSS